MIRQGCFQSFIKRIVKILWAIIAIAKRGLSGTFCLRWIVLKGFRYKACPAPLPNHCQDN
jgi:hypothetical protein